MGPSTKSILLRKNHSLHPPPWKGFFWEGGEGRGMNLIWLTTEHRTICSTFLSLFFFFFFKFLGKMTRTIFTNAHLHWPDILSFPHLHSLFLLNSCPNFRGEGVGSIFHFQMKPPLIDFLPIPCYCVLVRSSSMLDLCFRDFGTCQVPTDNQVHKKWERSKQQKLGLINDWELSIKIRWTTPSSQNCDIK